MRLVPRTVWTLRRQWLGNLIPALVWLPLCFIGLALMAIRGEVAGLGLWLLVAATVLGWLAVNFWGLFENKKIRREVTRLAESRGMSIGDASYVGAATPRFSSMLDPHEEVGLLFFQPEKLVFFSETKTIELFKAQVQRVRYRANMHTLLGLGRWVSVEGTADGKPIRLLLEPRERPTLMGNLRRSKHLAARIRRWLAAA